MTTVDNGVFARLAAGSRPIVMLTAYDAVSAHYAAAGGIDLILVGDSMANTVLGYGSTREITLDEMLYHVRAVSRGAPDSHLVGDMPVGTYDSREDALRTARLFTEAGCSSVKFEGGRADIARALSDAGIPTVGHIGLTPQTAEAYKVKGKTAEERSRLLQEAADLVENGIGLLIIECVPTGLGREISSAVNVPTVGIGAGNGCGGQVLVISDLLGMHDGHTAKFVRKYDDFNTRALDAVRRYADDVRSGSYPSDSESYH